MHLGLIVSMFTNHGPKNEAGAYPQLHAAVLQTPSGLRHVMPDLHIVASLHFTPSPPAEGEIDGFGEADVCIFVAVGVGAAPALVGQLAPSAAYFVLTRPVRCHSTPFITSFLLPLGLLWMFENASTMMSMEPVSCFSLSFSMRVVARWDSLHGCTDHQRHRQCT